MSRPLLLVLLLATFQLSAQRLENIRAQAISGGERVSITYDITGGSRDQKFKVTVYASHNNYSTPLSMVSGDVNEVTAGTGKRIEWNAKAEMVEYSGDITFELRADPVALPLNVKTPPGVKKGKSTTISYDGIAPNESVKLELVKGGVVVNQIGVTNDPGKYVWTVPSDVAKGSDYQVRLTTGGRVANSGSFKVKSKTSPLVYIIPGVVVVGAIVFLVTRDKDNGGGSKELPIPPDPE
ncbi:MAG TPA: Ser-Thr-rich GPI-anchored membrane family protein [Cyclobacteriaceae bacterium]|nr:Ser-Thr-rich GPI-anchored membrane family protein [Cyclobacteriaceae bacterium]